MSNVRRFMHRLATLFRVNSAERDLTREIASHLQLLEDTYAAKGMSREEARCAAKRAFGGVEQTKELQRNARAFRWLSGWPMDLRLGARMLGKSPGITVVATLALAVAIGAGAAYFEFFSDYYRPSVPIPAGERLVGLQIYDIEQNRLDPRAAREFVAWRESMRSLDAIGAYREFERNMFTADGRNETVRGVEISASAFQIAPTPPLQGRPLNPGDEQPGAAQVAVIGERVWRDRFGASVKAVGQVVRLDKETYTVVGVMPESFGFPMNHGLWTALKLQGGEDLPLKVFGTVREGVDAEAVQGEADAIARGLEARGGVRGGVTPFRVEVRPYVRSLFADPSNLEMQVALYVANVFFVGLLALCAANVATLVFGRTVTRETELTVRTALGASRGRIISQLVAEGLVLASVGATVGLMFASYALRWIPVVWERGQGAPLPFWWDARLGLETILYTGLLVLIAALIIGGIPALKATGPRLQNQLKFAAAGSTMTFGKTWTFVIVTQVAFTVVFLLSVVGLAWSISTIDEQYREVAFNREDYRVARFGGGPDANEISKPKLNAFLRLVSQEPAVGSMTYTTRLPGIDQEETPIDINGLTIDVRKADIGPNFFETFGRRTVAGRPFSQVEFDADRSVAIVDESFVRFVLGGRAAVGQSFRIVPRGGQSGPPIEIVGVVADMSTSPRKSKKDARFYLPIGAALPRAVDVVVQAHQAYRRPGLPEVGAAFRAAISNGPDGIHVVDHGTLEAGSGDVIGYVFAALGVVGAVALLLSTAGIYALVSFTLARRTREIGIRAALGAAPARIVRNVLSRALIQIGIGVALGGIPGALIITIVANHARGGNQLALGAATALGAAGFVIAIAAISCIVPLRRALRVQPTDALRTT